MSPTSSKFVADDLESAQTPAEQVQKSHGLDEGDGPFRRSAAEIHAALRLADGFDIDQMVSEYRALRASVVKQWVAGHNSLASTDVDDLTRFNEAIDQAVTESVAHYTKTINNSRNLFLGILGHDLRNPIGAASMAALRMERAGSSDPKQARVVSEIVKTTERASRILDDLLDVTRSSFGTDIPVEKAEMSMAELCQEIADELRGIHDGRNIQITVAGEPYRHVGSYANGTGAFEPDGERHTIWGAITPRNRDHQRQRSAEGRRQRSQFRICDSGREPKGDLPVVDAGSSQIGRQCPPRPRPLRRQTDSGGAWGEIAVASDEKRGTTFTFDIPRT